MTGNPAINPKTLVKVRIEVGQCHIENSLKGDARNCMVADALYDKLGSKYIYAVCPIDSSSASPYYNDSSGRIRIFDAKLDEEGDAINLLYEWEIPDWLNDMILAWDKGYDIQPFSFEMEVPLEMLL